MPRIILTQEQANVVFASTQPIAICAPDGHVLGEIPPPWSEEELAEAERALASDEPRYTFQEVMAHLNQLGQISKNP